MNLVSEKENDDDFLFAAALEAFEATTKLSSTPTPTLSDKRKRASLTVEPEVLRLEVAIYYTLSV